MDWKKLALSLGLDENSTPDQILAKAAEVVMAGKAATEENVKLSAEVKRLEKAQSAPESLDLTPKEDDAPEVKTLKERLSAANKAAEAGEVASAKVKLSAAKGEAESFVKSGKVPPALQADLEKLLSLSAEAQQLSLSQDGSKVVKVALDASAVVRKLLGALPGLSREALSQLQAAATGDGTQAVALDAARKAAKAVAARVQPQAKESK